MVKSALKVLYYRLIIIKLLSCIKKCYIQYLNNVKKSDCCHGTHGRNEVSFPTNIIDYKYILVESFKTKVNINK